MIDSKNSGPQGCHGKQRTAHDRVDNNDWKASEEGSLSASETEGSHTRVEGDDVIITGVLAGEAKSDQKAVSPAPHKIYLWCLILVLVVLTVAFVPALVIEIRDQNDNQGGATTTRTTSSDASTTTSKQYDTFEYTSEENDQCPGHLDEGDYAEISQIYFEDATWGIRDSLDNRTFEVEPSYTVLPSGAVEFNVETVTDPLAEDLNKRPLTQEQIEVQLMLELERFYLDQSSDMSDAGHFTNATLEVVSQAEGSQQNSQLVHASSQGFLASCMMAFAQHLPLALLPDHLWSIIMQGFARHVNQHAEELRAQFVDHQGKKEIRIREDSMVRGISPPEQWEKLIFPKFSQAIKDNLKNLDAHETLVKERFSTTTATSQAASEIVLMATLKSYFEYTMITACGIPKIRLEGSREDWVSLRERAAKLAQWMMPGHDHGELWVNDIVLPILDQFIDAYDGNVNYCFWQTMVKFRTSGGGSGSFDFLSGWLPSLFPYLNKGNGKVKPNPYLRPWEESASGLLMGPEPVDIPDQVSSVKVKWEYYNEEFPLHFHAGFRGVAQDSDGTLSPALGWYVSNDPGEK